MSTYDFAKKHLFQPLNVEDSYWYPDGQGIHNGGDGLRLTSRDMAKLGLLDLQGGQWQEKQIVSAAWVQKSIQQKFRTYESIGSYGFHWWSDRIDSSKDWTEDNFYYFALGFGGQHILIVPSKKMIVVFSSELYDQSLQPLALFKKYITCSRIERKPVQDTSRSLELVSFYMKHFTWTVRLYGQELYWHGIAGDTASKLP